MGSLFIIFIGCVMLGLSEALTIDNQLTVIRSDCYDRLAIGHRLNPKDIYKTFNNLTTVRDCQQACTEEKDVCKALSFGIGVKGNATCELGLARIKESADLKPIGTITQNDFDLYIKKLGCSLAIEKRPHIKPPGLFQDTLTPIANQYNSEENPKNEKPPNYLPKPPKRRPIDKNSQEYITNSGNSYHHDSPQYEKPQDFPNRPVNSYGYAQLVDKPTYNPEKPDNSYDSPSEYPADRPQNDYNEPHRAVNYNDRPSNHQPQRPQSIYHKNDYESPNHDRPNSIPERPEPAVDYDIMNQQHDRPNAIPNRPRPSTGNGYNQGNHYDRPQVIPDRPISSENDESEYGNQGTQYDRPSSLPNRPRPQGDYDSQVGEYDRPQVIPNRPISDTGYGNHGTEYDRPTSIPDRPRPPNAYDNPYTVYDRPGRFPSRPQADWNRPTDYDHPESASRPRPGYGSFEDEYERPNSIPNRPQASQNGYDRPTNQNLKPERLPEKPSYGRPSKPEGDAQHVQHLVSIASGPYPLSLHPVHNILVGTGSYRYGYSHTKPTNDREYHEKTHTKPTRPKLGYEEEFVPPFRPSQLNHPYNEHHSGDVYDYPDSHSRPRPYEPNNDGPNANWQSAPYRRPAFHEEDPDNYHPLDWRSDRDRFQGRPYYGRFPERYASYIPHPDEYNNGRPTEDEFYGPDIDRYDDTRRPFNRQPLYSQHYRRLYVEKPKPHSQAYQKESLRYNTTSISTNDTLPNLQKHNETMPDPSNPNALATDEKQRGTDQPTKTENTNNHNASSNNKSIVTQTVGPNGETITSIITEIYQTACFRRALAGKRVIRRFVRRSLICERVEDCQRECADETYFFCEGFNYRLDPTGRAKGDCELLDVPLPRLDIGLDLVPDPDYDYYERDRNAASVNCKQRPSGYYPPSSGGHYPSSSGGHYLPARSDGGAGRYNYYDYGDYYDDRATGPGYGGGGGRRPSADHDRRYHDKPYYDDYGSAAGGNRRGDFSYHNTHHFRPNSPRFHYKYHDTDRHDYHQGNDYGYHYPGIPSGHYLPSDRDKLPPYNRKPPTQYLPPRKNYLPSDRDKDSDYWGLDKGSWGSYGGSYGSFGFDRHNNRNRYDYDKINGGKGYYLPPKVGGPKYWGQYGGVYGNGGYHYGDGGYSNGGHQHGHGYVQSLDRWHNSNDRIDDLLPPFKSPGLDQTYIPVPHQTYIPVPPKPAYYPEYHHTHSQSFNHYINSILPAEPRIPTSNYLTDECSLRSATGFKLHRGIVKKFYAVPNIYECELLCYNEKDFPCSSYAYRYTLGVSSPSPNCYLSNKNYKELDFYTDVEPDKDFDIYTMNNYNTCEQPAERRDDSDCFWRVRSGQRLDHKVVRDSLSVKTIVDCQVECLESRRFTCRAFSFRYGSPTIGGAIDNCQLTDWPYYELDPRLHFIPEAGFEVYERGSYGHGCEPNHFGIQGKPGSDMQTDQLCYVGLGLPARLLPQATRKGVRVQSELDCKAECSKLREGTLFQCMSFSYRTNGHDSAPNCLLSDILQRDLLKSVDYVEDPYSWLFAWDNYNPQCVQIASDPIHHNTINPPGPHKHGKVPHDVIYPMDTWRVYSVSGWPCRRGSLCKLNPGGSFWYCELEFGDKNSWDYCCRPDHQCGYTRSFEYPWCYVGTERTQWRQCNDRYYPYTHNTEDRNDFSGYPYVKPSKPFPLPERPPNRYIPPSPDNGGLRPPHHRPDRPPASPHHPSPTPSLDDYENQFNAQFLEPPKPGGFGQPRHWPVSYLHKDMPLNSTDKSKSLKMIDSPNKKYEAIQNLINVIKTNDLNNIQYQITNESNKQDDILFVKIPLPVNFTERAKLKSTALEKPANITLEPADVNTNAKNNTKRSSKILSSIPVSVLTHIVNTGGNKTEDIKPTPVYRRSFITRTNVTNHGRKSRSFS